MWSRNCLPFRITRVYLWCVTRVTRWVPHVEQKLLTLPEHPSSPLVCNKSNTMGATCMWSRNCLPFRNTWVHLWFVARVTRWVPHVEQELPTLPGYLSSSPIFRVVRVARSLVLCLVFCRSMFVILFLVIVLTVLRITVSDYPFDIFKLFVNDIYILTLLTNSTILINVSPCLTVTVGFSLVPG